MDGRLTSCGTNGAPGEPGLLRFLLVLLLLALGAVIGCSGCATASIRPVKGKFQAPRQVRMTVTGYCNCQQCCDWRYTWYGRPVYASGPNKGRRKAIGVTASGTRARMGAVAADPSRYPMGTIVHVPGYGYGRVEDTGGAIKGDALDLWFPSHARAQTWGRQNLTVQVWLPR
jgi:3D (Asp-Asp-Asp) domain-containing protein